MTPSTTAGRASENSQSSKTSEPQTNPTPEPTFPLITLTPSPSSDIPEWADRALNAATFLWSLVDCNIHPLADSPKDAATADKPNEIRTCIDKINRFINGALNGLNPTQSGHGKASAAPDEGLRNALLALTNRIRAQEALRELKNLPHSQNTPNPKQTSSKLQREATNNRSPSPTPTNPPKPPKPSIQVPDLRFQGNPPLWRSASTTRATNKINSALNEIQETEGKLAAIAAIARPNGNYVVTFSGDSNPQLAVVIHNISLLDDNWVPGTEASLREVIAVNQVMKDVIITHAPRWLLPPAKLEGMRAGEAEIFLLNFWR